MQFAPQQADASSRKPAHNRIDLTGQRFGRLVVIAYVGTTGRRKAAWACLCDCGSETITLGMRLRSGHTTSCGCRQKESAVENVAVGHELNFKHGSCGTPTYKSWDSAKQRCFNPNDDHYPIYGGIGVTMCERWRASFSDFLQDMGERPEGTTLDRYPNAFGDYEPGNCRWATPKEQANNRRNSPGITRASETLTVVV